MTDPATIERFERAMANGDDREVWNLAPLVLADARLAAALRAELHDALVRLAMKSPLAPNEEQASAMASTQIAALEAQQAGGGG